jgi:hypothetical protein
MRMIVDSLGARNLGRKLQVYALRIQSRNKGEGLSDFHDCLYIVSESAPVLTQATQHINPVNAVQDVAEVPSGILKRQEWPPVKPDS